MADEIRSRDWRCIGQSVRGASHVQKELPNQDAIGWCWRSEDSGWSHELLQEEPKPPQQGIGPPLILVVSDGHGSSKSFRSQVGSRMAVETATSVLQEFFRDFFLENQTERVSLSTIKDMSQSSLPQRLVQEWTKSVEKHWSENPVSEEEWTQVVQKDGIAARQAIENNSTIAYGATLLVVVVTKFFILYLQLGDGDILCVDSQGEISRPLKRDRRLIANETTSLCMSKAWNEFQVGLVPYLESSPDQMPALIMVSTDGYANSYPSEEEFCKIGRDYREMIWDRGIGYVAQQLESFLKETSQGGSGDDISLGIIRRVEENDPDDQNKRITANEKAMTRQQELNADTDHKIHNLTNKQKKTDRAVSRVILGLIVTLPLALFSTVLSSYLFFRLKDVESIDTKDVERIDTQLNNQQETLKMLQQQITNIKNQSQTTKQPPDLSNQQTEATPSGASKQP
jgi:hypothetical protein